MRNPRSLRALAALAAGLLLFCTAGTNVVRVSRSDTWDGIFNKINRNFASVESLATGCVPWASYYSIKPPATDSTWGNDLTISAGLTHSPSAVGGSLYLKGGEGGSSGPGRVYLGPTDSVWVWTNGVQTMLTPIILSGFLVSDCVMQNSGGLLSFTDSRGSGSVAFSVPGAVTTNVTLSGVTLSFSNGALINVTGP